MKKAPVLPEELVDSIRARLPVREIFQTSLVCKRWAEVCKSPHFCDQVLQHIPEHLPWLVDVRPPETRKQLECLTFDLCQETLCPVVIGILPSLGLSYYPAEHGTRSDVCSAAAGGLVALIHGSEFHNCVLMANPLLQGGTQVLHLPFSPVFGWFVLTLAMLYSASDDTFKVLVTGRVAPSEYRRKHIFPSEENPYSLSWTGIYSSSSKSWQVRVCAKHANPKLYSLTSVIVGEVVYLVVRLNPVTIIFSARNIHDGLPMSADCCDKVFPEVCDFHKVWPNATWNGVPMPPLVVGQSWLQVQLVDCYGRLLLMVSHTELAGFDDYVRIFEFDPAQGKWVMAPRMPPIIVAQFFTTARGLYHGIQCICYGGAVHLVNWIDDVTVIFDPFKQCWSMPPESLLPGYGYRLGYDHLLGITFQPSLRAPSTYFKIPQPHLAEQAQGWRYALQEENLPAVEGH